VICRNLALTVALAALAACGDNNDDVDCDEGAIRCTDNVAETCMVDDSDDSFWYQRDCGDERVCVLATDTDAVCSVATDPDPRCAGDELEIVCQAGVLLECFEGYALSASDCGSADLCRTDLGPRNCLLAPDPDPLCEDTAGYDHACDDDLAVTCLRGWRILEQDCGSADLCHAFDDGFAGCVVSTDPDPRCEGITDALDPAGNFCDGGDHLTCDPDTGLMLVSACESGRCAQGEDGRNQCVTEDGA
jgi:hypothetical protein